MKYLKTFETQQDLPEVGDYVLMNSYINIDDVLDFVNKTIGIVNAVYFDKIVVRYEDIPGNIDLFFHDGTRIFDSNLLIAYGKTIEELELKIQANKFNI